jgi:1-acyl-sn-glycerol-3-phosphate acyltransferase
MANHQSNIDIPVLMQSLAEFQLRWLAKKELLFVPFFGWAVWASSHIIVDRSNRSQAVATLRRAKEQIARGISLVIFPEGTRSVGGQLLPFKRGGFVLALRTRTPIVPVAINGSGAVLPRGDWRIRRGEVEVIIGEPVPVEQYQPGNIPGLLSHVRSVIESYFLQHGGSFSDSYEDARATMEKTA